METLSQMMMETPDLNQERLKKLKELFPDLFTVEGRLNDDELRKLVEPDATRETERYDFRWFGKAQAKRNAYTPTNTTLVYDKARSVNPNQSENIIIEGENLEVLKLLLCAYREKIKAIYIDPPYNTGKDFVYSDNYTEEKRPYWQKTGVIENGVKTTTNPETSGRYHSDWLNMMYSRLLAAHSLLRNDGVIFISIDDNEIYNLRKLCNEVFGIENFVAQITVLCNPKGRSQDKHFATNHEYILVYSKSILPKGSFSIAKEKKQLEAEYKEEDEFGKYRLMELRNTHREFGKHNRKNLWYPFYVNPVDGSISLEEVEGFEKIYPYWDDGFEGCWTWEYKKADDELYLLEARLTDKNKWKIYRKDYAEGAEKMLKTIFNDKSFYTEKGQSVFNSLFDTKEKYFQSPKSVELLKNILNTCVGKKDFVLDFFSGAGSVGQAIFELNEDGGNRKFILVQLPELIEENSEAYKAGFRKISDITIERNKRVIEKILNEREAKHPELFVEGNEDQTVGLGFHVFKLVKSNFPRTEFKPDPNKTDEENLEELKEYIKEKERQQTFKFNLEELLTEILLKQGFMLTFTYEQKVEFTHNNIYYATDGEKKTLICLDEELKLETIEQLKETDKKFICLERALDTTKKWNLKHYLSEKFQAF